MSITETTREEKYTLEREKSGFRIVIKPNEHQIKSYPKKYSKNSSTSYFFDLSKNGNPKKLIQDLERIGRALYQDHLEKFSFDKRSREPSPRQEIANQINLHVDDFRVSSNEIHTAIAFDKAWKSRQKGETEDKNMAQTNRIKEKFNTSERKNINFARMMLMNALKKSEDYEKIENEVTELDIAYMRAAIADYEKTSKRILRYIGYGFGTIFSVACGINNGNSMGASIITIAAMMGILGLTLGMPMIAIPALFVGFSSFMINCLVAIKASGNTFANLFGRDKAFETLTHRRIQGKLEELTVGQKAAVFLGGGFTSLFSALSLATLGGYVLMLTLMSITALAPFALPIAAVVTLSSAMTLFFIYLQDSAGLIHSGLDKPLLDFAKSLLFPTDTAEKQVNQKITSIKSSLEANGLLDDDMQQRINTYATKARTRSKILTYIATPVALAGIGLTLYGAALAIPVLFPFLGLTAGLAIAFCAFPGQIPFYSSASAVVAGHVASSNLFLPSEIKDALKNNRAQIESTSSEQTSEQSTTQETKAKLTPLQRLKNAFDRAVDNLVQMANIGNPLGNGAIGMVGVSFQNPIVNAVMLPVTFVSAAFASLMVGLSRAISTDPSSKKPPKPVASSSTSKIANSLADKKALEGDNSNETPSNSQRTSQALSDSKIDALKTLSATSADDREPTISDVVGNQSTISATA